MDPYKHLAGLLGRRMSSTQGPYLHRTTQNTVGTWIFMSCMGFEPTITAVKISYLSKLFIPLEPVFQNWEFVSYQVRVFTVPWHIHSLTIHDNWVNIATGWIRFQSHSIRCAMRDYRKLSSTVCSWDSIFHSVGLEGWIPRTEVSIELFVSFEVFTAVTIKNAVFWDVAPCRYCVNRRFGGTYRHHLQGIRNPRARNQREQIVAATLSLFRLYSVVGWWEW
jgi:hypothetical protein